jgi:beta-1,2-mannobiose phosphorylase / 1,2-beta-oligomannan phosphorylase
MMDMMNSLRQIARGWPGVFRRLFLAGLLAAVVHATVASDAEPMRWADNSRLGRPFSKDPSVIRFGGRYLMYFSLPPFAKELAPTNAPRGWSIGIAESTNLFHWRKVAELWPKQVCDRNGLCAPGARVLDGKVHLFYQTYGNGTNDAICHAVSDDGVRFRRDPSNPIFRPSGAWTCGRAIDAEAFPFGDRLLLFFATRDPLMKTQMLGVAAAPLKSDFSRGLWRQLGDGPILKPELPWETRCLEAPTLCQRGDTLFLFHAGGYNNDPQQVGVATSKDGVSWKRLSHQPLLPNGAPGEWNSSESGHPGIFVDTDGRTWLFFQGNPDKGKTWLLSCEEVLWQDGIPGVKPRFKRANP